MPTGVVGLWVPTDYAATPQPNIKNQVNAASPISANLIRGGPNQSGKYWGLNGITATDFTADGVGGATATRIVGTGNWYYEYLLEGLIPAGTYCLALEIISNSGSSQSLKTGDYYSAATITATTSWTTITKILVVASTGSLTLTPIRSLDGATAGDVSIKNIRLFSGSVDLGADNLTTAPGHMLLGTAPGTKVPPVTGGYMSFAGANVAAAMLPQFTMTGYTVCAIFRKTAAGYPTSYEPFISKDVRSDTGSPYTDFSGYMDQNDGFAPVAASSQGTSGYFQFYNQGWHYLASCEDASGGETYIDDSQYATRTNAFSSKVISSLTFGTMNGLNTFYHLSADVACLALFNRRLTKAEHLTVYNAMVAEVGKSSIAMSPLRLYVAEGDSITALINGGAPTKFIPNASPPVIGTNFAKTGSQIFDLVNRQAQVNALIPANPGTRKFIISVLIGANDLTIASASTWLTNLASCLDTYRAAGLKVVLCTPTPKSDANFNTARATVLPTLRGWVGTHCDAIADFAANATVGTDAAGSNVTYYPDGTHPSDACNVILETVLRLAVNGL